jgi:hypothetical protein
VVAPNPPQSFAAGALVIPMDTCYNADYGPNTAPMSTTAGCAAGAGPTCYASSSYPSGNVRLPFGLIYLLALNHIPVSVILNPTKTSLDTPDFTVTPVAGSASPPDTANLIQRSGLTWSVVTGALNVGVNAMSYWGMPFVVDAPYADQALSVIAQYDNAATTTITTPGCGSGNQSSTAGGGLFDSVPIHVVNYPFTAPVLATLASRPKPVLIDGAPLDTFFSESGIVDTTVDTYLCLNGSAPSYSYTWPVADLGTNAGCPGGNCTTLVYTDSLNIAHRIVDVVWAHTDGVNTWTPMKDFYKQGGTALVVADATGWENGVGVLGGEIQSSHGAQAGSYCATDPVGGTNLTADPGPSNGEYPASDKYLQIGDMNLFVHGQGAGDTDYTYTNNPAAHTHALTNNAVYNAIAGHPIVDGAQQPGDVVYLGSLNSWHGGSHNKDAGLHIMYNSLLVGGDGGGAANFSGVELSRSSPVAKVTGETYIGTFDWKIPADPTALGDLLYIPPLTHYPYVTGHFREYKPGLSGGASLHTTCSATDPNSPCNWDASTLLPAVSSRKILWVQKNSSGTWSLNDSAISAGDSTITYVRNNIGTQLGGVDWSTGAVIEGKGNNSLVTITGAQTRPTISYVGARDGMLHAFCADANKCYGKNQGEEIWAVIPPGVQAQLATAITNSDFSKVNVGGVIRVGDFNDLFPVSSSGTVVAGTSKSYRTVLIGATRESGHTFALDISNPDPAQMNQPGFMFLWQQDGTDALTTNGPPTKCPSQSTTVGKYAMGATMGCSVATVTDTSSGNTTFSGIPVCTSAIGAPVSGSSQQYGINTYLLRMYDGKVMASDQKVFSRLAVTVGGSTAKIPNDPPPIPTLVDLDLDGADDAAIVTDAEGVVRKIGLDTKTSTILTCSDGSGNLYSGTMWDSATHCSVSGQSCQPIGVPVAVAKYGTAGDLIAFFGTGGADWAASASRSSYAIAFPLTSGGYGHPTAPNAALGTVTRSTALNSLSATIDTPLENLTLPAGGGILPVSSVMETRSYAQFTVTGKDVYAEVTTLSVGNVNSLIQPLLYPGNYGGIERWQNLDTSIGAGAYLTLTVNFAGGVGSLMETNSSTNTTGQLTIWGSTGSAQLTPPASSLRDGSWAVEIMPGGGSRPFQVLTWFDY